MTQPTEHDRIEAIGEQLRAKLTSKFTASTFLAGFALAVLTGQVFALWQGTTFPLLFAPSVGGVFGALALFVFAIVKLDALTMPKRFWQEDQQAEPSSFPAKWGYLTDDDLWELQKRMIFFWQRLTIVATSLTAISVMAMLIPVSLSAQTVRCWTFVCALFGVVTATLYYCWLDAKAAKTFNPLVRPLD